jgi:hypothetical protein
VKLLPFLALSAALCFAGIHTASGGSIGINFTGGGNGGSPAISLLSSDTAGVVAQMNWNNFAGEMKS